MGSARRVGPRGTRALVGPRQPSPASPVRRAANAATRAAQRGAHWAAALTRPLPAREGAGGDADASRAFRPDPTPPRRLQQCSYASGRGMRASATREAANGPPPSSARSPPRPPPGEGGAIDPRPPSNPPNTPYPSWRSACRARPAWPARRARERARPHAAPGRPPAAARPRPPAGRPGARPRRASRGARRGRSRRCARAGRTRNRPTRRCRTRARETRPEGGGGWIPASCRGAGHGVGREHARAAVRAPFARSRRRVEKVARRSQGGGRPPRARRP